MVSKLFVLNSSFILFLISLFTSLLFSLYMYKLSIEPVVVTEKPFELHKISPIVIKSPQPITSKPIPQTFDYSIPTCTKYNSNTTQNGKLVKPVPGTTLIYPIGQSGFLLSTVVPITSTASFYL